MGKAAVGHPRQCQGWTTKGDRCRAYAVVAGDFCVTHSLSPQERIERSRRMNQVQKTAARERRNVAECRPLAGYRDGVTLQDVLDVIREGLSAEHELPTAVTEGGFTVRREADYDTRLLCVLAITRLWPREFRASPETIRDALERSLPSTHVDLTQRATEQSLYVEARKRWFEISLRHNRFRGLFLDGDLPSFLLAPGERTDEVMRHEGPSFDNWKVRDVDSATHVLATDPQGNEHLIERDAPRHL